MRRPRFIKTVPNNGNDDPDTVNHPEDGQDQFTDKDRHDHPVIKQPKNPREAPEGILPNRWSK